MVIFTSQNTKAAFYRMTWTEAAWRQGTIVVFQESGRETKNKSRVHEERRKKRDSGNIKETGMALLDNQGEEDYGAKDSSQSPRASLFPERGTDGTVWKEGDPVLLNLCFSAAELINLVALGYR